ncbi:2Fe-2S iron-sulfur cluster-binding protein [Rhodococcus sp. NPDC127530]|uniref:2Fe-2S iron-sulfur cluster-binding protein n=1 Tax=unclassified Rhodococcus (in: high G+C Gram-positive bacteria) TaxID=192944 RepID=UPI0036335A66
MPKIIYRSADGAENYVDALDGTSVMQAAVSAGIDGIVAECGGNGMCATCHIYLDPERLHEFPAIEAAEDEMLDCAVSPRREGSRLSCQLPINDAHDGIVVELPEAQ